MKAHIKNYMSLTKKDWNGITVLLVLIALALAAPHAYQWFRKDSTINVNEFNAAITQLNKANHVNTVGNALNDAGERAGVAHFKFDPNNLSAEKWQELGLTEQQANTIKNYTAKGGKFYKPEDIRKIYGITADDYKRLLPYIDIPSSLGYTIKVNTVVELNTADSAKLTTIQGIGPAFATRIIYYRERLGGFISKEQLKEIYGLDEIKFKEVKDHVKVNPARIRRININTITFDKLRLMPYLNYKQVNALVEYRKQHGNYNSMDDLKSIAIIDDQILRKIEPYIIF
jgi:competence ComEA-like helix-hairpin-helix protein